MHGFSEEGNLPEQSDIGWGNFCKPWGQRPGPGPAKPRLAVVRAEAVLMVEVQRSSSSGPGSLIPHRPYRFLWFTEKEGRTLYLPIWPTLHCHPSTQDVSPDAH